MFIDLHKSGNLVSPEQVGHVFAALAANPPHDLSGSFCSQDEEKLKDYRLWTRINKSRCYKVYFIYDRIPLFNNHTTKIKSIIVTIIWCITAVCYIEQFLKITLLLYFIVWIYNKRSILIANKITSILLKYYEVYTLCFDEWLESTMYLCYKGSVVIFVKLSESDASISVRHL